LYVEIRESNNNKKVLFFEIYKTYLDACIVLYDGPAWIRMNKVFGESVAASGEYERRGELREGAKRDLV